MINRSLTARLPARWWQPVARPHAESYLTRVAHAVFLVIGIPLSAVGWYQPFAFRVIGWAAKCCAALTRSQAIGERRFGDNTLLFPLFDTYWCGLAFPTFIYEDELSHIFRNTPKGSIDLFIDGGANIGLWSVVASNLARTVVSVEASPATLPLLKESARLAAQPFEVIDRALWKNSHETLSFSWDKARHSASSLTAVAAHDVSSGGWQAALVKTICIDDLVKEKAPAGGRGLIFIKLDVEGAEVQVIDGAAKTLSSDRVLLVYEDHAQDPSHKTTAHVLSQGLSIYHLDQRCLRKIQKPADVEPIKRDPERGYNFFACRAGGPAERFLLSIPAINEAAELVLSAPLA
jgi:FkbM family methyltransferase